MKYDDQPGMTRTAEYGRPFNRYMPTRYLVDLFDEEKDQRYAGSFRNLWIMNNEKGKGKYTAMTDTAIYIIKGRQLKLNGHGQKIVISFLIEMMCIMQMVRQRI